MEKNPQKPRQDGKGLDGSRKKIFFSPFFHFERVYWPFPARYGLFLLAAAFLDTFTRPAKKETPWEKVAGV